MATPDHLRRPPRQRKPVPCGNAPGTELTDTTGVSRWLGVPVETVRQWRRRGDGPPFLKLAGQVRYHVPRVREWLAARERTSTANDDTA